MGIALKEKWHAYMDKPSPEQLDLVLHPDCCFVSPVVFTPQKARTSQPNICWPPVSFLATANSAIFLKPWMTIA